MCQWESVIVQQLMRMIPTRTYPNQKLVNGQWGYAFDPDKGTLLGGISEDGRNFTHTFTVLGVDKADVMFAVALCGLMYGTRQVMTSYKELVGKDESSWRLLRYDVELHN